MGLVSEVKTLGAIAIPNGKPSIDKASVAKQTIQAMVKLNNRNMQLSILEINRKRIISLMNKL